MPKVSSVPTTKIKGLKGVKERKGKEQLLSGSAGLMNKVESVCV